MNCARHTDAAAVAYCRSCGKALCEACKREVQGTIYCEPCLAARINPGGSGNFGAGANAGAGYGPARAHEDARPGLALFLGFIPGVGAFYNGQFLKGFVHVIVFGTLIWMSDHGMGFIGILVMAWFFYMVFDAYTTAKARRDGLPIPDPIGLNAILEGREGTFRQRVEEAGERVGAHVEYAAQNIGQHWQKAGGAKPGATAAKAAPGDVSGEANPGAPPPPMGARFSAAYSAKANATQDAASNAAQNTPPGSTAYMGPQGTYYSGPEGTNYVPPREHEHGPAFAIVLIGLGVLFLMANLGWFSFNWLAQFWPVILIVVGLWLFIQRRRGAR